MSRLSLVLLFALITFTFNATLQTLLPNRDCSELIGAVIDASLLSESEGEYCSKMGVNGDCRDCVRCCMIGSSNGANCYGITDDEYENVVRFKKYLRDQVEDDSIRVDCSSRFISISLLAVLALLF